MQSIGSLIQLNTCNIHKVFRDTKLNHKCIEFIGEHSKPSGYFDSLRGLLFKEAEVAIFTNCDKDFMYTWFNRSIFCPWNLKQIYINSHQCECNILRRFQRPSHDRIAGSEIPPTIFLPGNGVYNSYKRYWATELDNVVVLPDKGFEVCIQELRNF